MAELLLELFCEELPLWAQQSGRRELHERLRAALRERGFFEEDAGARDFATPRRLTLMMEGLQEEIPPRQERRRGPRTNAPEKAILGFCKSAGVTPEQLQQEGEYFHAVIESPKETLAEAVASIVPQVIAAIPWQKSMRWGEGGLSFPRSLRSVLCMADGETVEFELAGLPDVKSGNVTRGHHIHASDVFAVTGCADYEKKLRERKVILDSQERQDVIERGSERLAEEKGFLLAKNPRLLETAAAMTEWPVPILCSVKEESMRLPDAVLLQVICGQQGYFAMREKHGEAFAPFCIAVADMEAADGGDAIRNGHERVLRARLNDADFFYRRDVEDWKQVRETGQEEFIQMWEEELHAVVFYQKAHVNCSIGSQVDKVARYATGMIEENFSQKRPYFRHDEIKQEHVVTAEEAETAARLAKLDLLSDMVREFPKLQGVMGAHYALHAGFSQRIAPGIGEHYQPQGLDDSIPQTSLGQCIALSDKMCALGFFWSQEDETVRPSGSGDPYGLRRAALGVIRILLEAKIQPPLKVWIRRALDLSLNPAVDYTEEERQKLTDDLFAFFIERLKVYLRQREGLRPDVVEAVLFGSDNLLDIFRRAKALSTCFPDTEEGQAVLKGYKRAANILRDEKVAADAPPPHEYVLREEAEKNLFKAVREAEGEIMGEEGRLPLTSSPEKIQEAYIKEVAACARLRAPIDDFFDQVRVNADDPALRENRLRLLRQTCRVLESVADFSKISDK